MMKMISNIKTLAALLMAGAAFTACSSSDDVIEQPANPTEPQVYTLVIKASKGDANTRALSLSGSTLNAYWSGEETIEVYQNDVKIGTATAAASPDGNTTITAELTSAPNPSSDLDFYLGGKTPDYTGQNGLLTGDNSISEKYDYAMGWLGSGSYTVDDVNYTVTPNENTSLEFGAAYAEQAVIKFTLQDKGNSNAAISPSAFTVSDGTSAVELTSIPAATYTTNGDGVLFVAFPATNYLATITLTATVGNDTYTYTKWGAKFEKGQYYEITVKMTKQAPLASSATTSDIGKLIGADGRIYSTQAAATTAGTTAVAMIAYVGTNGHATYNHGLALALVDMSTKLTWDNSGTYNDGKTAAEWCSAWNTSKPVNAAEWLLASKDQWDYMMGANGAGSYTALRDGFGSVGGTNMLKGFYWSSTEKDNDNAWDYNFGNFGGGDWYSSYKNLNNYNVRACLAF